ncbi:molybdopterin-dependent oxidoreductase [Microlunatus sp. Gsoil 973]|uniref:molybdopterin-dependent oxidoreductase n=1 Tax=Microlunatus sp. Gsoil 973 TaxID=2672569 RepID=UPI0012B4F356|nr:molybdopterin-dependent oxidoreductase [Microlunatus sp. Gsoil 973]QGN34999.1 molybdopterin-dependent oxidoreductase [Microlunatus sp. Gsoil 973]
MIKWPLQTVLRRIPEPGNVAGDVQTTAVVARIGVFLGPAFGICFLTGLISHNAQATSGILLRPWPVWGYRLSQGIHVATGIACLPLLLAKIFAAYPRILTRPEGGSGKRTTMVRFAADRLLVGVLTAAGIVQVATGIFNVFQWYIFRFDFVPVHYAVAWIAMGAILIHVATKLPTIARAVRRPRAGRERADRPTSRRGFVGGVLGVSGGLVLFSVGQTIGPLDRLAFLAPRRPRAVNLQGVPANRTAAQAGVTDRLADWSLTITGPIRRRELDRGTLAAMPQTTVRLPIACVEGWSIGAEWSGVRIRELIELVGGGDQGVRVVSLERGSRYAQTILPADFVEDDRSILALTINGEALHPDHGFPARVIAPNRLGALQTKWVERLEVL